MLKEYVPEDSDQLLIYFGIVENNKIRYAGSSLIDVLKVRGRTKDATIKRFFEDLEPADVYSWQEYKWVRV